MAPARARLYCSASTPRPGTPPDDTNKNITLQSVVAFARKHGATLFSREALRNRKEREGLSSIVARRYASEAFEFQTESLDKIEDELGQAQTLYEQQIEALRHKAFAHRAILSPGDRQELFRPIRVRELEHLLIFPLRCERALFDLFHNGRRPVLADTLSLTPDVVKHEDQPGLGGWPHLWAASSVRDFLAFFRNAPMND